MVAFALAQPKFVDTVSFALAAKASGASRAVLPKAGFVRLAIPRNAMRMVVSFTGKNSRNVMLLNGRRVKKGSQAR